MLEQDQKAVDAMAAGWHCDQTEKIRRFIDLVTVSVLLDAGAGVAWKYTDANGNSHSRSEGLAIASSEFTD